VASRRKTPETKARRSKPATTPEAREHEMVALALDLAETQIKAGTASSQVNTHFLKAGSLREQLEQERIQHENELLRVKKEALESQQRVEEMYVNALNAMRSYAGQTSAEDEAEDEDD
jgi:hypothetical protein